MKFVISLRNAIVPASNADVTRHYRDAVPKAEIKSLLCSLTRRGATYTSASRGNERQLNFYVPIIRQILCRYYFPRRKHMRVVSEETPASACISHR